MAERAGAGFGRALIQRDDAVLRDHERHQIGDGVAAFGVEISPIRFEAMSSASSAAAMSSCDGGRPQ